MHLDLYDLQKKAFYFGLTIDEFWNSTLADVIRFVNANADRVSKYSREQWSIMRYQTACIMQMLQDSKSKPIQPTDILKFADEQVDEPTKPKELTKEQSDKLNAAYQRYLNRV